MPQCDACGGNEDMVVHVRGRLPFSLCFDCAKARLEDP